MTCLLVEATEIFRVVSSHSKADYTTLNSCMSRWSCPNRTALKVQGSLEHTVGGGGQVTWGGEPWTQGGPRELCAFSMFHVVQNNLENYPRSMWVQRRRLPANLTTQFLFNKCQMQLSITADFYIGNDFLRWLFSYTSESSSFISSLYLCRLPNDADYLFHFCIPNPSYPFRPRSNVNPFAFLYMEKISVFSCLSQHYSQ